MRRHPMMAVVPPERSAAKREPGPSNHWSLRDYWVPACAGTTAACAGALPQIQLLEEIVALVVDDDEGGEILHLDPPDRLHAELGIFENLDLLDAMLGEVRRGAANGGEVEPAVLLAGLAHLRGAVALGHRAHRAAGGLEIVDEGIHPAGGGRAERS